jgi:Right handed beta helix region
MDVDDAAGWTIEGNHALTTSGDGIFVARMYATRVSGNYIEDFADLSQGIDAQSQPNTASEISGNEVFNEASKAPGSFIRVTVARGAATVGVTDNVIHGVGLGVGLDYRALVGTSLKVTSSGNVVSNVGKKLKTTRGVTVDSGM